MLHRVPGERTTFKRPISPSEAFLYTSTRASVETSVTEQETRGDSAPVVSDSRARFLNQGPVWWFLKQNREHNSAAEIRRV